MSNKNRAMFYDNQKMLKGEVPNGNQFKYNQPYFHPQQKNYDQYIRGGSQNPPVFPNQMRFQNRQGNPTGPQMIHPVTQMPSSFRPTNEAMMQRGPNPPFMVPNEAFRPYPFPNRNEHPGNLPPPQDQHPAPISQNPVQFEEKLTQEEKNVERNKYSVLGLLKIINTKQKNNSNMQKLALGFDLTTLGLNLNSTEYLHKTFSSPYIDEVDSGVKQDFSVPKSYMDFPYLEASGIVSGLKEETIFYIFYSMPRDYMQLAAAKELSRRKWIYHMKLQTWMKPIKVEEKTHSTIKGKFQMFDVKSWEKVIKNNFELRNKDRYNFKKR